VDEEQREHPGVGPHPAGGEREEARALRRDAERLQSRRSVEEERGRTERNATDAARL